MKTLAMTALAAVMALAAFGRIPAYGQDAGQRPGEPDAEYIERLYEPMADKPRMRETFDRYLEADAIVRARQSGVMASKGGPYPIVNGDGTYVFADEFQRVWDTLDIDASGNVVVEVWRDGARVSSLAADQITVRGAQ